MSPCVPQPRIEIPSVLPLIYHEPFEGRPGFWAVMRYADVQHVNRDNILFSSSRQGTILSPFMDEESLAQAVRRFLANDHEVEALTNGREALERIRAGTRYDVILCDLMMPQMTGMELHEAVLRIDADQARRMVFLTGGAFTQSARAFMERTANHRIEKPFDLKALRNLVNDLIR